MMNGITDSNQHPGFEQEHIDKQITGEAVVIPVIEEQWHVSKKIVETGKVVLSKKVYEEEVTVDVPLMHEEHDIERITVNQYVDTPPDVRYEGETMIIPVLKEEVVVQKRILLVEELRITKRQIQTNSPQQITLRKEEVIVDRDTNKDLNPNLV